MENYEAMDMDIAPLVNVFALNVFQYTPVIPKSNWTTV